MLVPLDDKSPLSHAPPSSAPNATIVLGDRGFVEQILPPPHCFTAIFVFWSVYSLRLLAALAVPLQCRAVPNY